MPQYFDNDPNLKSERKVIYYKIKEHNFSLFSDKGVFAKDGLDRGTLTLIEGGLNDGLTGRVLDIGCGLGVVGVTLAALQPDLFVTMSDVNKRALTLAQLNVEKYQLNNVEIIESDLYTNIKQSFAVILANPPIRAGKNVVYGVFSGAYDHLNMGGKLLVVIRKSHGAPSAKNKLTEIFGNCEIIKRNKGYYLLKCVKNSK